MSETTMQTTRHAWPVNAAEPNATAAQRTSVNVRLDSTIEGKLRRAIVHRELVLQFQPQVSLVTGRTVGAEALLRWRYDEHNVVLPETILAVAEASGLMDLVDEFVLDEACNFATALRRAWLPEARIGVNISAPQCGDPRTVNRVEAALLKAGLPAQALEIEITEGAFDKKDARSTGIVLGELSMLGVQLSIDDFGAGAANLIRLAQFRFDRIKLDRALVCAVDRHRTQQAIVRAVVSLADELGYGVLAEGVESEAQWHSLAAIGCHEAQGFAISRPLHAHAMLVSRDAPFQAWV